jgi:hypothetical protein
MSTETVLLLILIVFVVGALPAWPHSRSWGYAPGGVLTLLLIVFLVWAIAGGRPLFRSSGSLHDAGHDLRSAGRDAADSLRHAVQ